MRLSLLAFELKACKQAAGLGKRDEPEPGVMPRGVIVIRVKEAHGRNKKDEIVWEPRFIEGFVRAELRGVDRSKQIVSCLSTITSVSCIANNEERCSR